MGDLHAIMVFSVVNILKAFLNACILGVFWPWFFVPLGLPDISVFLAAGLSLTISCVTY